MNREIETLIKAAEGIGLRVSTDTDIDNDNLIIDFVVELPLGREYLFYIELYPNADSQEISDQLFMLADDFCGEFVESETIEELCEEYDIAEIKIIKEKVFELYRKILYIFSKDTQ